MPDAGQTPKPEQWNDITSAAERVLSDLFGSTVHLTGVECLSEPDRRNLVLRCICAPGKKLPSRFIIKKVEGDAYHPENPSSWDTQRFFSDWIGSQFLSSLGSDANHGPRFYGGHRELGFIVLEDMGEHRSLVEPLLHENAASAEAALLRYSTRLGTMHAATASRYNEYETLFQSVSSNGPPVYATEQKLSDGIERVQALLEHLEVQIESSFLQEVHEIISAVVNPGAFLAYIHGDPCPDNVFDRGEQLRLIDFEFGRFGHVLIDATYARMIFPTCWCANRIPLSIVEEMEHRYRTELVQGCPQAQEDSVFEEALVRICGHWLLNTLDWHLEPGLKEDQSWGIASLRQRIMARLEAFIATSEKFNHFPEVRGTAGRLLDTLSKRWTDTDTLPVYPALQGA